MKNNKERKNEKWDGQKTTQQDEIMMKSGKFQKVHDRTSEYNNVLGVALFLLSSGFFPDLFTVVLFLPDTGLDCFDCHVDITQVRFGRCPDSFLVLFPSMLVGTNSALDSFCNVHILQWCLRRSDLLFRLLLLPIDVMNRRVLCVCVCVSLNSTSCESPHQETNKGEKERTIERQIWCQISMRKRFT